MTTKTTPPIAKARSARKAAQLTPAFWTDRLFPKPEVPAKPGTTHTAQNLAARARQTTHTAQNLAARARKTTHTAQNLRPERNGPTAGLQRLLGSRCTAADTRRQSCAAVILRGDTPAP